MKKFFLLSSILLSFLTDSQTWAGINLNRCFVLNNSLHHSNNLRSELQVQKIIWEKGISLDYLESGNISFESVLAIRPSFIHGFALAQKGHGNSGKLPKGNTPELNFSKLAKTTVTINSGFSFYFKKIIEEGIKTQITIIKTALEIIAKVDFISRLKNIQCPALIIWNKKDAICIKISHEAMANYIKKAKQIVYDSIPLRLEQPQRFVNDLQQFIQSIQFFYL
jgi:hypothetical protein